MFGRGKKVVLDPWLGDTEAAAIRAALEAGDRGPLVDAYNAPTTSPWSRFPEMFREYQSASGAR